MESASPRDDQIEFVVPVDSDADGRSGEPDASATPGADVDPGGLGIGTIEKRVRVSQSRDGAVEDRVSATPGTHVISMLIERGPTLVLHPEHARELFAAQRGSGVQAGRERRSEQPSVRVPSELSWAVGSSDGAARSIAGALAGGVALRVLNLLRVTPHALARRGAEQLAAHFDSGVVAGLHAIDGNGPLDLSDRSLISKPVEAPANGAPLLVLLHGTFSSTAGAFSTLWSQSPHEAAQIADHYRGRLYCLEHPTLATSPIANALALAKCLGKGTNVHLLTHSRGGLVAEVLANACAMGHVDPGELTGFTTADSAALKELVALVHSQGISVSRIVRVACPARGTSLASRRLDVYLSVMAWAAKMANAPLLPQFMEFLGEVARQRMDPDVLPGLAAQMPGSPLIRWLHRDGVAIKGDLRVIAGDAEGESFWSWVKTLVADAFYMTENDFVVQTRSMYGGARRLGGATFFLEDGGHVSHMRYFANRETARAVVSALCDDTPERFYPIGELSWAGEHSMGERAAAQPDSGSNPALIVVPGLFGSHLKADGRRVWLGSNVSSGLERLAWDGVNGVEPDGLVEELYGDLCRHLAQTHDVIPFAYDWRRSLAEVAGQLADVVETALGAREGTGQAVRLLAHSTGGLVARLMQSKRGDTWRNLLGRDGSRVLMVGTPHGGWWIPMRILAGEERLGGLLDMIDLSMGSRSAQAIAAGWPGLVQTQADLTSATRPLASRAEWERLEWSYRGGTGGSSAWHAASMADSIRWSLPSEKTLGEAVELRKELDRQRSDWARIGAIDKVVQVLGTASSTPAGLDEVSMKFLDVADGGDGCATHESSRLEGASSWLAPLEHADLVADRRSFLAIEELLLTGTTRLFEELRGSFTGTSRVTRAATDERGSARSRASCAPPETRLDVVGFDGRRQRRTKAPAGSRLQITVVHGDLRYVRTPLMLGHYRSSTLTGSELVMNRIVGGAMAQSMRIGRYPDAPGEHQVFQNLRVDAIVDAERPRPEAVIVVGLGQEGSLRPGELATTVCGGVLAWAQRAIEQGTAPRERLVLSATLLGSGGVRMSAGGCARQIAQGVRQANQQLSTEEWPTVGELHLVELYLDRASEAWRAVHQLAKDAPKEFGLAPEIRDLPGGLLKPLDSSYRGTGYDLVSARTGSTQEPDDTILFTIDTRRARVEEAAQSTQLRAIRAMVKAAAVRGSKDGGVRRSLFRRVVPQEIEGHLLGSTELQIEVDEGTAGIPWELLDPGDPEEGGLPWAIRSRLLRRLRTADFPQSVIDAGHDAAALVIGEPLCDSERYGRLPGARREAQEVAEVLKGSPLFGPEQVTALISTQKEGSGPTSLQVMSALDGGPWRIVHIAAHGEAPEVLEADTPRCSRCGGRRPDPRGVVLSDQMFLGPQEFLNLRVVPELVFVNCCFLAGRDPRQIMLTGRDRPEFARGVAQALIERGVKCVIAAGWAVGDAEASTFARSFYEAILDGQRFIDAVALARTSIWSLHDNTWAAYQAYGDAEWTLARAHDDSRATIVGVGDLETICSEWGVINALRTVAQQARVSHPAPQPGRPSARAGGGRGVKAATNASREGEADHHKELRDCLQRLELRCTKKWASRGDVAEAFGAAWAELGDREKAVRWYEAALAANDGLASFKTAQELGQLRAKMSAADFERRAKSMRAELSMTPEGAPATDSGAASLDEVERWVGFLERLADIAPTVERHTLCGSAYKQLARVAALARDRNRTATASTKVEEHCVCVQPLVRSWDPPALPYPALVRMAFALQIGMRSGAPPKLDQELVDQVRAELNAPDRRQDFWTLVNRIELTLYVALSSGGLAAKQQELTERLDALRRTVRAAGDWSFVASQTSDLLEAYNELVGISATERAAATAILDSIRRHAM